MDAKEAASNVDKLAGSIDQLGHAMAKVAPQVWETMVWQARLENGLMIAVWCIEVLASVFLLRHAIKLHKTDERDVEGPLVVTSSLAAVFTVACVAQFCIVGASVVTAFLNPEYTAAMQLVRAL